MIPPEMAGPSSAPRIVVVGGGPLCAYALERLAALLPTVDLPRGLRITVYDRTGRFGAGDTHSDTQAPTSYMNRVASQIAFAADESNAGAGPLLPRELRPTFYEWASARYAATGDERFRLLPSDVPHRHLHGIALREAFDRYVSLISSLDGVTIDVEVDEVVEISPGGPGEAPFAVRTSGRPHAAVPADHVLLVTGHSTNRIAEGSVAAVLAEHARRNPPAGFVASAYPLDRTMTTERVPPGSRVGMLGLGLTAIDAMLHLTEGRGGRFEPVDPADPLAGLRYTRSGREPSVIVPTSPSGMLVSTRARNDKAADGSAAGHSALEHRAVFLTVDAVRALRSSYGVPGAGSLAEMRQLDFGAHLFPLIVLELAHVYYTTLLGTKVGPRLRAAVADDYADFLSGGSWWATATPEEAADRLVAPVDAEFDEIARYVAAVTAGRPVPADCQQYPATGAVDAFLTTVYGEPRRLAASPWGHSPNIADHRFDWRRLFDPIDHEQAPDGAAWHRAHVAYVRRDLAAAEQGNLRNPVKAACDGVWRDLRGVLSEACDFGGLTPRSHREALERYLRYYTRMSNGTGPEPMWKILALIDAGVVDLSIGPRPMVEPVPGEPRFRLRGGVTGAVREVDVVVEGKAHPFDPDLDVNPLYRSMMRHGLVRRWRNPGHGDQPDFVPGGLDVSREFHPVGVDGRPDPRLTVFGAPVEGVALFQLTAARPRSNSSILNNVARWAADVVAAAADAPRAVPDPLTGVGSS